MTDDGQAVGPPKHDVAVSPAGVMATAIEDLEGLAALGPNWDGYGSAPPTDLARRRARSILDLVGERFGEAAGRRIEPDTVAAMPGSGVLLEWRADDAALEVDIGPGGEIGYLFVDRHDGERRTEEGDDASPATIMDHLATVLIEGAQAPRWS